MSHRGLEGREGVGDRKFFKSDIGDLRKALNSNNANQVKDAVKKVIASMTTGKDVSSLFTDVIKSLQTNDVELKKLVYLYVITYARGVPEKSILVVNTFQRDCADKDPLIRSLALRTMGCIRDVRIGEYLCDPLGKALKDGDPYVRKTAAICVAKLHDINPELAEDQGFLKTLRNLIADENPMVVSNAVAALAEISENSGKDVMNINKMLLQKLLYAVGASAEWGQVYILDCLAKYQTTEEEAEEIIERVSPLLKHVNPAVTMSAMKVIVKNLSSVKPELEKAILNDKLAPTFITLLSEHKPEIQYVALRNINIIAQKYPDALSNHFKHFYCKYADPVYVKMEKLELLVRVAHNKNIERVLQELNEYAREVDVDFVRKAVLAIGRCAIKLEKAAEKCVQVLLDLIKTKISYVVQEAICVIQDIFRKYPNKYESIIAVLCENLYTIDEASAKASLIWIIGEYNDRIENSPDLLQNFLDTYMEEQAEVQLQLLTAVVKLFIKRPTDSQKMIENILKMTTDNVNNPDLRDRGFVYWRLLSENLDQAQQVVCAERPLIADNSFNLDDDIMDCLIQNLSTLASVYHKPPETFVYGARSTITLKKAGGVKKRDSRSSSESESESEEAEAPEPQERENSKSKSKSKSSSDGDSSDSSSDDSDEGKAQQAKPEAVMDILDLGMVGTTQAPPPTIKKTIIMTKERGKGLQVASAFVRKNNTLCMDMTLTNMSNQAITNFYILVAPKYYLGVEQANKVLQVKPLSPGESGSCLCPLKEGVLQNEEQGPMKIAFKTQDVVYCAVRLPVYLLFSENGRMDQKDFHKKWDAEQQSTVKAATPHTVEALKQRLTWNNVFVVAHETKGNGDVVFCSLNFKGTTVMLELNLSGSKCEVHIRPSNAVTAVAVQGVLELVKT